MTRIGGISSQAAGTATSDIMTTSMTGEAESASSAGNNKACSNGESRENGFSDIMPITEGRDQLLCHESG